MTTSSTTYRLNTLRAIRVSRELLQVDVARAIGMTQPRYSEVERGRRQVSIETARRMAEVLRVPVSTLLVSVPLADLACA